MFSAAYMSVVVSGLLHGFEPGRGRPIAVLDSMQERNLIATASLSSPGYPGVESADWHARPTSQSHLLDSEKLGVNDSHKTLDFLFD